MVIIDSVTAEVGSGENLFDTTIAVVVKKPDKVGENKVSVFIPKLFPAMDISSKPMDTPTMVNSSFLKNSKVRDIGSSNIKISNFIDLHCNYPSGLSMPDFQEGDKVLVRFIDQDMKTMYCEESPSKVPGKKEGERIRMGAPAKKQGSDENVEFSKSNEYAFEIDSRKENQRVLIQTTKINGEKAAMTLSIDGKNGVFYVNAGGEEMFKYSSEDDEWLFKTKGGATFSIKDKVVEFNCSEFIINAEDKIKFKTESYNLESEKITEKGTTVKKEYQDLKQKGSSATFEIDQEKHKGLAFRTNHTIGFQVESPMMAVNGLIAAVNMTFGGGPPSIDIPISVPESTMKVPAGNMDFGSSNITAKTGNFDMGAGAMPLAKANPIATAITKLATYYDLLTVVGQAVLVKAPAASASLTSDISQIPSMNVKGM